MSFELRLNGGDITIGPDADFGTVVNGEKLIQDVIKIITTPQGSNRFQPQIGSLVNEKLIGQLQSSQNSVTILQGSIQEALITLQKLQKQQSQFQALSPSETLISLNSISVKRDAKEPRQLNVVLNIVAGDGLMLSETLTMRLV